MQHCDYDYSVIQVDGLGGHVLLSTNDLEAARRLAFDTPNADVFDNCPDTGGWLRLRPIPVC